VILVREHQFLAATGNVGYTFNRGEGRVEHALRRDRLLRRPLRGLNRFTGPGRVGIQSAYVHLTEN
jgi:uncharacterized protein (AIM24 family)